jgi:hypothetical protein
VLPPQGDHRFIGRGSVDDAGDVTIDGLLEPVPHAPQPALFLPSAEAPRTQLSDADRALWLAANLDGGLDIARLVPAGSQASTLFMLDSAMLSKAVLNGNIEAAVYVPPERGGFPPVVIAFGVRSMAAAVAAMDLVVERVSQTFQVAPVPYAIGDRRGSCLPGVNILPELAPCYAALPDAIVIGWNARALEHALAPSTHPAPQRTTIAADFAAFARADDVLQKTLLAEGQPVIEQQYPWSKLDVTMGKGAEGYAMSLHLAGATQ